VQKLTLSGRITSLNVPGQEQYSHSVCGSAALSLEMWDTLHSKSSNKMEFPKRKNVQYYMKL